MDSETNKLQLIVMDIYEQFIQNKIKNRIGLITVLHNIGKKYKIIPSIIQLLNTYNYCVKSNILQSNKQFEELLKIKNNRSQSGVIVITVFTSPFPTVNGIVQHFSCNNNCHYCPKEPGQPRSYLTKEPAVARANQNNFNSSEQFWSRCKDYLFMGHPLDKIELIISGGTFTSYPREYIIEFVRDLFYAANIIMDKLNNNIRSPKSLEEEQLINQNSASVKIIGITIETRPDKITKDELIFLRKLGVTRVQIGVQHIDDRILEYINRGCTTTHTINAISMLKHTGFKVDIHLMPDLPHPDTISINQMIQLDKDMFNNILNLPQYQADQWKIYPCEVVPWTEIENW